MRTDKIKRLERPRRRVGAGKINPFASPKGQSPLRVRAVTGAIEAPEREAVELQKQTHGWIVTVYDNDVNTYEEVMTALMIATGCTAEEAYIEAWEVDHLGKSVVHHACERECRQAAKIIGKIGITVEVSEV